MHLELVSAIATAPGAGGAAAAALTGDSLTVRNGRKQIAMVSAWGTLQLAGFVQIAFPTGHDTTRGLRVGVATAQNSPSLLLPLGTDLELSAQETLSVTLAGSATAGDIEQFGSLIFYEDFPGISQRLIDVPELEKRTHKRTTIESTVANVATGQYADELITADSDLLIANRDYALLGITARSAAHNLYMRGPDFGNLRIGVPGMLRPEVGNGFFLALSRASGRSMIPVFNSGNKSSTFIGFSGDETIGNTVITAHVALLK